MPACSASERKEKMYKKTQELFSTHKNYMIMSIRKVKATQLKDVKQIVGSGMKLLVAKNKIMKKALEDLDAAKYADIIKMLHGDVVIAFFDDVDPRNILETSKNNMRKALAVPGDIAPVEVVIPAGPTGLGPEKINVFQAAKIATKINKGKIDLVTDHKLLSVGDIVTISQAKLLTMLNILPFEFGLDIVKVFENGEIFDKNLLLISEEDVSKSLVETISLIAALSLGSETTTEASVPFEIKNAFADVVKLSLATGFTIHEFSN